MNSTYRRRFSRASLTALLLLVGCAGGSKGGSPSTTAKDDGVFVRVEASTVNAGLARGILRQSKSLEAYSISKYPVTWAQYDDCVTSGRCETPDPAACGSGAYSVYSTPGALLRGLPAVPFSKKASDVPALCVGESKADAYCKAKGGRLPTIEEWMLAARGPSPVRFAWGGAAPTCDRHPLAALTQLLDPMLAGDAGAACAAPTAPDGGLDVEILAIGKHPGGAAPSGLEDALLSPGELVAGEAENMYGACSAIGSHCIVAGSVPGSIDTIEPIYQQTSVDAGPQHLAGHAYAFRCVIQSNSRGGQ